MFILSTLENWNNIMKYSIYAYSDKNNPEMGLGFLFIIFILIGSIFSVNLFVAVLNMNFMMA